MKKPLRYRYGWNKRHQAASDRTSAPVVKKIIIPTKRSRCFKVRDTVTGFYWTGRADHSKFYDDEGISFTTKDEAQQAIGGLLSKATNGVSSLGRMKTRLAEISNWEIVEAKLSISILNRTAMDSLEYKVLVPLLSQNRTAGMVFQRHLEAGRSHDIKTMIHLDDYTSNLEEYLNSVPKDQYLRDRTVLSFKDAKWSLMLKLSLPKVREIINVQAIRDAVG